MAGNKSNCSSLNEKLTNNFLDGASRNTYLNVNDFSTKANISVHANFCLESKKLYKKRKEKSEIKLTESCSLPEVAAQPVNESGSLIKKVSKSMEPTKYTNSVLRPSESITNFIPSPNRKASGEFAFKRKTDNNSCEKTYAGDKFKEKSLNQTMIPYKSHSAKNLIDCGNSQKVISHEDQLEGNKRTRILEKKFVCDRCEKAFKQNLHLNRHYRSHTNEKPFVCDTCGKGFADKRNLVNNELTHTGEKPYECGVCKKRFSQTSTLIKHKLIHTNNMPFGCALCEIRFKSRGSLMLHRRKHKAGYL